MDIAGKALELKLITSEDLEAALEEGRLFSKNEPQASVLDILLQKGALEPRDIDFVRASMLEGEHPSKIGGFELLEKIGEGSMGVVYKARQSSMDRLVAFKVLSPRLARNPRYVARFTREARSAARLNHPNIVGGIDVGQDQGFHYFAMEYIDGKTVQDLIDAEGALSERRAVRIAGKVASALEHAWDRGLIHRDIKPGNIVITSKGQVKITDLGLAKYTAEDNLALTDTGTTVGTANYISPEQAHGEEFIDIRSDIYSLGATLFHMVTGKPPYTGTPVSVMTQHASADVPDPKTINPDLSDSIAIVIQLMMQKAPGDRYASPRELILDLARLSEGKEPLLARSDAGLAALKDAAEWEDKAQPQMVTRDEMARLKRRIGWGRTPSMALQMVALAAAVALLALVFMIVYTIISG